MRFQKSRVILALLFILPGCAPDRSLDDYKREQLRRYLGEYQAAAGIFRGLGYLKADHTQIGAIELILTAKIKTTDATAGSKAEGTPVLKGKITLYGLQTASLDSTDGFYDPDTGIYQANIPIKQQNGRTSEISISGKIEGDSFDGSIEVNGYPAYGSEIHLTKNASLPKKEEERSSSSKIPGDSPGSLPPPELNSNVLGSYQGTTSFRSGSTRPVSLVILSTRNSSEEDFLNFFNPIKTVQVTLNYGDSIQILHPSVEWNQQTHRMIGTASMLSNNNSVTLALQCSETGSGTYNGGWDCQTSTTQSGWVARTQVKPVTSQEHPPAADPGDSGPLLIQYRGQGKLLDETLVSISMSALLPPRSRETELAEQFFPPAERLVTITILFPVNGTQLGSVIPISFENARWDLKTHVLNGTSTPSSSNQTNGVTLTCQNFELNKNGAPFECQYIPHRWGAPISLRFQKEN